MRERFMTKNIAEHRLAMISIANKIIDEYQEQGFTLTLRQLYYQFVARDLLPNTIQSYNNLGSAISDGRMCGMIDWEAIEDRTRSLQSNPHFKSPKSAIQVARDMYGIDMWQNQERRVEVWIEKNALIGVIAETCERLDVPYFACIGYVSQSEAWRAYRRHLDHLNDFDQMTVVLHLGDHDPSGIDMTRDNQDRLDTFFDCHATEVVRLALNMNQIEEFKPPPNPAKSKDPRFKEYIRKHGHQSWELDALDPRVMARLIEHSVKRLRDEDAWAEMEARLDEELETLNDIIGDLS